MSLVKHLSRGNEIRRDRRARRGAAERARCAQGQQNGVGDVTDVQDRAGRGQHGDDARVKMGRARDPAVGGIQRRDRDAAEGVETGGSRRRRKSVPRTARPAARRRRRSGCSSRSRRCTSWFRRERSARRPPASVTPAPPLPEPPLPESSSSPRPCHRVLICRQRPPFRKPALPGAGTAAGSTGRRRPVAAAGAVHIALGRSAPRAERDCEPENQAPTHGRGYFHGRNTTRKPHRSARSRRSCRPFSGNQNCRDTHHEAHALLLRGSIPTSFEGRTDV